jgi:hypothetical protein
VILGVLSAAVLYFLFFIGNALAPYVVHEAPAQVGGIYGLGTGTSRLLIFLLLLLITGPGEEIFWRGFLQSRMMARWGNIIGYVAATAVYGATGPSTYFRGIWYLPVQPSWRVPFGAPSISGVVT